jgi:hypothetical protein
VFALPIVCLGFALAQDATVAEHEPALVDRIVAVVGDRLVLASDVAIETEIGARNVYTLSALADRRKDASRWLVDMAIVRELAGDVRVYEPTRQDVADALERFAQTFGDAATYRAFLEHSGLSQERLQSLLTTRLIVERYIQRNVGLGLTDAELAVRFDQWIAERRQQVAIREIAERSE